MKKQNLRFLTIIGLVVLLGCSWYSLFTNTIKEKTDYAVALGKARNKVQLKLYDEALDDYKKLLRDHDTIEMRDEIAQVYKDKGDSRGYEKFCESMTEDYPYEKLGYERLAYLYCDDEAYFTFYRTYATTQKRGIKSQKLDELYERHKYKFKLNSSKAVEVGEFSQGLTCVRYESGYYGYQDTKGNSAIRAVYSKASPFSGNGHAAVQTSKGDFVLINTSDRKKFADDTHRKIEDCTSPFSNIMAVKYDGKYHYCDMNFRELFGSYDMAGSFNCGVAPVKAGEKWAVINSKGEKVTDFIFDDFKLDHKGVAFRNNVAFAKKDGKLILIDVTGKQVGSESWEDADIFSGQGPAAVKKAGKWGFIDSTGKEVIAPQYEEAHSFANGFAGVKIGGSWGAIYKDEKEPVIKPQFEDIRDFTENGSAFVKYDGQWNVLRIFRLAA